MDRAKAESAQAEQRASGTEIRAIVRAPFLWPNCRLYTAKGKMPEQPVTKFRGIPTARIGTPGNVWWLPAIRDKKKPVSSRGETRPSTPKSLDDSVLEKARDSSRTECGCGTMSRSVKEWHYPGDREVVGDVASKIDGFSIGKKARTLAASRIWPASRPSLRSGK